MARLLAFPLLVAATVLAGCYAVEPPAGELALQGSWRAPPGAPAHLIVAVANGGGQAVAVPIQTVQVSGPSGAVPVRWPSGVGDRELLPGERVELEFHAVVADGALVLALDHAAGEHVPMPPGAYDVCIAARCAEARLALG